jgi:hypothetical protein
MNVDHMGFAIWAIAIVAAGTAVIMYQHSMHTDYLLNVLSGGAIPVSPGDQTQQTAVAPGFAPSQFTGIWTPIGPSPRGPFNETPNPQYPNPQTYPDYFSVLGTPADYLDQNAINPGMPQIGNTMAY